jgi:hypothetical protein
MAEGHELQVVMGQGKGIQHHWHGGVEWVKHCFTGD